MSAQRSHGRIDRPIFVVGVDHSGTSILFRMLARHDDLAWFSQYSVRGGEFPWRRRVPFASLVNRIGRRVFGVPWQKWTPLQQRSRFLAELRPAPRETVGLWRRIIPRTDECAEASDVTPDMVDGTQLALSAALHGWRRSRIIVKVPYLTRKIRLLDAMFPDALFIHIVRDGKAVALSNRDRYLGTAGGPEHALRHAAGEWVDTLGYVAACAEDLDGRYHELRYEDLCADVHGEIRRCLEFCGLSPDRADLEPVPTTLRVSNERWFARCDRNERSIIDEVQRNLLGQWGYEPFGAMADSELGES